MATFSQYPAKPVTPFRRSGVACGGIFTAFLLACFVGTPICHASILSWGLGATGRDRYDLLVLPVQAMNVFMVSGWDAAEGPPACRADTTRMRSSMPFRR
jgi:hypothetical protein